MFSLRNLFNFKKYGQSSIYLDSFQMILSGCQNFLDGNIDAQFWHEQFASGLQRIIDNSGLPVEFYFNTKKPAKKWYATVENKSLTLAISQQLFFLALDNPIYAIKTNDPLLKHIVKGEKRATFDEGYLFRVLDQHYYLLLFFNDDPKEQIPIKGFLRVLIEQVQANIQLKTEQTTLNNKFKSIQTEQDITKKELSKTKRALRRRAYEIDNLLEISNELYSILDLQQLMNSALLILVGQLGCEKAFALLNQPDQGQYSDHFSKGFGSDLQKLELDWTHPLIEYLTKRKQPVFIDDLFRVPKMKQITDQLKQESIHIIAPLVSSGRMTGVVGCGQKLFGDELDENDIQMFSILVNIISVSVSNARMYENVKKLSLTDSMTDLNNYRSFEERLKEEINRSFRRESCVSLLMLDIDNFKNYNDSLGHQAGDEALRQLGKLLKTVARDEDIVNRYGGEEFSIILPDVPKETVYVLAERIRESVEKESFYREDVQPEGKLTVSLGGATLPDDASNFEKLVNCADKALYDSKEAGRNRFTLYDHKK